jgi:hypothetical protein
MHSYLKFLSKYLSWEIFQNQIFLSLINILFCIYFPFTVVRKFLQKRVAFTPKFQDCWVVTGTGISSLKHGV